MYTSMGKKRCIYKYIYKSVVNDTSAKKNKYLMYIHGVVDYIQYVHVYMSLDYKIYIQCAGFILTVTVR